MTLAVLHELLAPYLAGQRVLTLLRHQAVAATTHGDRVEAVQVRSLESGNELILRAPYFADATELGDLLPLTRTEYVTGAEARKDTGEPHAKPEAQPLNMQGFTCCFAMDYVPGEDHVIEKPREYDFWRDYVPDLHPPWPGKLLAWEYADAATHQPRKLDTDPEAGSGLWSYRRLADKSLFVPGTYPGDISLVNWPQNDYWLGNLCEVTEAEATRHLARAKQLSLSLLYWLQTSDATDGGTARSGCGSPGSPRQEDGLGSILLRESADSGEFTVWNNTYHGVPMQNGASATKSRRRRFASIGGSTG